MKKRMKTHVMIGLLGGVLGIGGAQAAQTGQIETASGVPHVYSVVLTDNDLNNVVGDEKKYEFTIRKTYPARLYCATPGGTVGSPMYYQALTNLPLSDTNGAQGFHRFNDYLDVKMEVYIHGNLQQHVTVPFYDVSNRLAIGYHNFPCNHANPPMATYPSFESGGKGIVTFKLRKPLINGIDITSREIVEMFGRVDVAGAPKVFGNVPMVRIIIEASLLMVPDKCVVNDGRPINVDFGNIGQERLDGTRYVHSIPVRYQCSGGSFDDPRGSKAISIGVSARPASFSNDYIASSTQDLGIVLKHNGQTVKPNQFTPMPASATNSGAWDLTAAPVSFDGGFSLGEFTANGTIVMEFTE